MTSEATGPGPLIGRAASQDRLLSLCTDAHPASAVTIVSGPPGIGKSTLLRSVASTLDAQGLSVGWGVAGEWDGAPPLWPWYESMSEIDPGQTIIDPTQELGALPVTEKVALFRAVTGWLSDQADQRRTIVFLEDLHEADDTTVDLVAYLARRPVGAAFHVVVSTRPGVEAVENLRCTQVALDGLSASEIEELAASLGQQIDASAARALVARTDGNPLFVQRLIEQGFGVDDTAVPNDVSTLLGQQLARVKAADRRVLDALAVVGTTTSESLLQRLVAMDSPGASHVVDAPEVITRTGGSVGFRHSLLRDLVYDALDDVRRSDLHALVAEALRSDGAGPTVLAHHLGRAALSHPGTEAAVYARQAGQFALSMGALPEATEQFALAATIRQREGEPEALAVALLELARALSHAGQIAEAEARLDDAASLDDALSVPMRHALVREYGRLRWREEPNPSSLQADRLEQLAQRWLADDPDPAAQAVLETAMVSAAEIRGIGPGALTHADAAVAAAHQSNQQVLIAEAHVARRRALMAHHHRLADRREDARAAAAAARQADDAEVLARARRLALCDALAAADRRESLALIEATELAPSSALREHEALWTACLASLEGRYDDTEEILDDAAKELAYLGVEAPALDFVRAVHLWDTGSLSEALAEYEPLLAVFSDPVLSSALALGKAIDGDHNSARTMLDDGLEATLRGPISPLWPLAASLGGEAAAAIDHPAVPDFFELLLPYAGQCAVPAAAAAAWVGSFDRILGLLCLRMGRDQEAMGHLQRSAEIHDRMKARPWLARSLAALGLAAERLGDTDKAAKAREQAEALRIELGMRPVLLVGSYPTTSPAAAGDPGRTEQRSGVRSGVFRREGDVWRVGLDGDEHLVRHSGGFDHLALLLQQVDTDWHVLDLYATANNAPVVVEGHGGVMLDEQARSAYQQRYHELTDSLTEADADADQGRAEQLRGEIEQLEHELLRAFGLGGRARTFDAPTERARVNVRRAITRALDRIDEASPALADHLRRRVDTGRFCRYTPDPTRPVDWQH